MYSSGSAPTRIFGTNDYSCKDTFSFAAQIKKANISKKFLVSFNITGLFTDISLEETIDIAINLILNDNLNLIITKKEFKKFSTFLHQRFTLFLTVKFIIKLME